MNAHPILTTLEPFWNTFHAHYPVIVSTLLAFLFSDAALKQELAVQNSKDVPPAPVNIIVDDQLDNHKSKPRKSTDWWKPMLKFMAVAISIGGLGFLSLGVPIERFTAIIKFLYVIPSYFMIRYLLCSGMCGFPRHVIFRNHLGGVVSLPLFGINPWLRKLAGPITVFALVDIAVSSFYPNINGGETLALDFGRGWFQRLYFTVVWAVVTYVSTRSIAPFAFSFRLYFIFVLIYCAGIFVMAAVLIFLIGKQSGVESSPPEEESAWWTFLIERINAINEVVMPPLLAEFPTFLVAACLRFDFSNHPHSLRSDSGSKHHEDLGSTVNLKTVSLSDDGRAKLQTTGVTVGTIGVVVPLSLPSFPRTYFITSLVIWTLTHAGLIFAFTSLKFEWLSSTSYSGIAVAVHVPLACVTLCGVALSRGEFGKLWKYNERTMFKLDATAAATNVVTHERSVGEGEGETGRLLAPPEECVELVEV